MKGLLSLESYLATLYKFLFTVFWCMQQQRPVNSYITVTSALRARAENCVSSADECVWMCVCEWERALVFIVHATVKYECPIWFVTPIYRTINKSRRNRNLFAVSSCRGSDAVRWTSGIPPEWSNTFKAPWVCVRVWVVHLCKLDSQT